MTPIEPLQAVVYDASTSSSLSCACGCSSHDHSGADPEPLQHISPEIQAKALALTLESAFPGKVRVEYINFLKDPRGPELPQMPLFTSLIYPAPLVDIGGCGWFAWALDPEGIKEEVAKCLEEQSGVLSPAPRKR